MATFGTVTICVFLLALGAVIRVTRFLNSDALAEPLRDAAARRWGDHSRIAYLLGCPWCASIWIAPLIMYAAYRWGETPWFVVAAGSLAVSQVTGLVSLNLDEE